MNEQLIDPKDLVAGSYVLSGMPAIEPQPVQVMNHLDGKYGGSTTGVRVKPIDPWRGPWLEPYTTLSPIAITPEWLESLGFINTFSDLSIEGYSIPEELADELGAYPGWEIKHTLQGCIVRGKEDTFFYSPDVEQYNPYFCKIDSIHHLQALVWNLERVWLTLDKKEVNHE